MKFHNTRDKNIIEYQRENQFIVNQASARMEAGKQLSNVLKILGGNNASLEFYVHTNCWWDVNAK